MYVTNHNVDLFCLMHSFMPSCSSGHLPSLAYVQRCFMPHQRIGSGVSLMAFIMRFRLLTLLRWSWKYLETVQANALNLHKLLPQQDCLFCVPGPRCIGFAAIGCGMTVH